MSQFDFGTIDPATKSGTQLASDLNAWRDALHSGHKGSAAPSYAASGTLWIDDSANPSWTLKLYDGTDWIDLGTLDTTSNVFSPTIAADSIGTTEIAAGAVTSTEIATDAVTSTEIATDAVTSTEIATDAVTNPKLGAGAVSGAKIAFGSDAQGDITYHNGSIWTRLGAGTSGQVLQTQGAGANPHGWITLAGSYSRRKPHRHLHRSTSRPTSTRPLIPMPSSCPEFGRQRMPWGFGSACR